MTPFAALDDQPRYVAWRNERRGDKTTKVPYGRDGRHAKADDPATWVTRREAEAIARRKVNGSGGGVGIQLGDIGADLHLGGLDLDGHVAAYLDQRDLSAFNPKAPPQKTDAFWDIVNAHRPSETAELADVLDSLGNPDAVTLREIITADGGNEDFSNWLKDRKNRTKIPHRFEECGYTPVRNPDADDGLWRIQGKREVVYSKSAYSKQTRIAAAEKLRAPRQWRQ